MSEDLPIDVDGSEDDVIVISDSEDEVIVIDDTDSDEDIMDKEIEKDSMGPLELPDLCRNASDTAMYKHNLDAEMSMELQQVTGESFSGRSGWCSSTSAFPCDSEDKQQTCNLKLETKPDPSLYTSPSRQELGLTVSQAQTLFRQSKQLAGDKADKGNACKIHFEERCDCNRRNRRRITCENQATSYPEYSAQLIVTDVEFLDCSKYIHCPKPRCKIHKEESKDSPKFFKPRILSEKQAFSSPVLIDSAVVDLLHLRGGGHSKQEAEICFVCDHEHSVYNASLSCERVNCSHNSNIDYHQNTNLSREFACGGQTNDCSIPVFEMANLERNKVFGCLSSAYLPVTSIQSGTAPLTSYHYHFVEMILENEDNFDTGLPALSDFTSRYSANTIVVDTLLGTCLMKHHTLAQLYSILLSVYQRNPQIKPDSLGEIFTELLSMDCHTLKLSQFKISMFLTVLELNLFSQNWCEPVKIKHSCAHSLLSWDCNRASLQRLVQRLPELCQGVLSQEKVTSVYLLQRLIALALDASVRDQFIAVQFMASAMKTGYMKLWHMEEKTLLLSTIENPWITFSLTRKLLEERYEVQLIKERFPTLKTIVKSYFGAVPRKLGNTEANCEELAVLLYFVVRSCIECTKSRIEESRRARLLTPGFGRCEVIAYNRQHLILHLQKFCETLPSSVVLYVGLIDCLLC